MNPRNDRRTLTTVPRSIGRWDRDRRHPPNIAFGRANFPPTNKFTRSCGGVSSSRYLFNLARLIPQWRRLRISRCTTTLRKYPSAATSWLRLGQLRWGEDGVQPWSRVPAYAVEVANANITRNTSNRHTVALASFDTSGPVTLRVKYTAGVVDKAAIRPLSLGIQAHVEHDEITFNLERARDVMLEINGDKWKALHLLVNTIDENAPTHDSGDVWYFGPGINQGSAYWYRQAKQSILPAASSSPAG